MGEEVKKEVKLYVTNADGEETKVEPVEFGEPDEGINKAMKEVIDEMREAKEIEVKMDNKSKKRLANIVVGELAKKSNDSFSCMCNNIKRDNRVYKEKEIRRFLRETRRKDEGRISRKRFRKLLYSVGYGRKAAEEIIEVEWNSKGYYDLDDFRCWNMMKYEEENK